MSPLDERSRPRFGGVWAKVEIFFGLTAVGIGLLLGGWAVSRPPDVDWLFASLGVMLFILGGYLALAGQRSHLYRSNMEPVATLREELRQLKDRDQVG